MVDTGRLRHLLAKTVDRTGGLCVEKLERLHSVFSQHVYRHRRTHNKTTLTQVDAQLSPDLTSPRLESQSDSTRVRLDLSPTRVANLNALRLHSDSG